MNEPRSINHVPAEEAPLSKESSQPHLRALAPTRREFPVTVTLEDQGTILLRFPRDDIGLDDRPITLGGLDFKPKDETHVTVIGFKFAKEMKKAVSDPAKAAELIALFDATNRVDPLTIEVDSASPIVHLARDITVNRKGGITEIEHHESLIVPVACPKIDSLLREISRITGTEIPGPYLHVTLYTHGAEQGIGVPTESVLETLKIGEIAAPEFDRMRTASRSTATEQPLTPHECGIALVQAITGADPVSDFETLATRPEVANHLRELLALKEIPQDPHHHPEGSVYVHTMRVLEEAARVSERLGLTGRDRETALLGALLHDIGKGVPGITTIHPNPDGTVRIRAHQHERAGVEPAHRILSELGLDRFAPGVLAVVEHHMTIPARYREVERGNMSLDRCIERTRAFIQSKIAGVEPEILHACMIADWRGRGLADSAGSRERFIDGFSELFRRATRST